MSNNNNEKKIKANFINYIINEREENQSKTKFILEHEQDILKARKLKKSWKFISNAFKKFYDVDISVNLLVQTFHKKNKKKDNNLLTNNNNVNNVVIRKQEKNIKIEQKEENEKEL